MQWKPDDDQSKALSMMMSQAAVGLFADPGKGKTSTCLAAFKILKEQGLVKKMLVVAPIFPLYNSWTGELSKWDMFNGLTYTILHGKNKQRNLQEDVDIYFINYEGLLWLFPDPSPKAKPADQHSRHTTWSWDVLCADEGTNLKDSSTKRFKRVRSHIGNFRRRWVLSGKPAPNGYADLFGQIFLLDNGSSLGRYITHFRNSFMRPAWGGGYEMLPNAEAEIEEAIKPLVIRLEANYAHEDVPLYTDVYLPDKLMERYKEFEREFILDLTEGGEVVASNAAILGNKLRQFCDGGLYYQIDEEERGWEDIHAYKVDALKSIYSEVNGAPLLVFYEFQFDKEKLLAAFPNAPVLGGGVSPERTKEIIFEWNMGTIPIMFAHPKSAAHGLNLQECANRVVWFTIPWNLEWYDQANARLSRRGQKNDQVYIHHIRCINTKDEDVIEVLRAKDGRQNKLLKALAS